jgi:hypothetical protein
MEQSKSISPLNLLTGIRELLTDPERWIKDTEARSINGARSRAECTEAVCFCLQGAAIHVANPSGKYDAGIRDNVLRVLLRELKVYKPKFQGPTWEFNDNEETTHEDVLKFLDTRIEAHLKEQ